MVNNNLISYGESKLKEYNLDPKLAKYLYKYLDNLDEYENAINKLIEGKPVQYIVGNVDFYGLTLKVNENVLIPRFETEELVDRTIKYINQYFNDKIDIVDIGTGSGAIAISIKKNVICNMDAVDISKEALEVAKENANNLECDINFYLGDLLEPLNKKYDVIISNPPYISYDEKIEEIVKNNEPHLALYAEHNGLKCYEDILSKANSYLKKRSFIAFEIGYIQGDKIKNIALKYFPNAVIKIEKDLQDKERFIFIFNEL